jgi:hypothetical protein
MGEGRSDLFWPGLYIAKKIEYKLKRDKIMWLLRFSIAIIVPKFKKICQISIHAYTPQEDLAKILLQVRKKQ